MRNPGDCRRCLWQCIDEEIKARKASHEPYHGVAGPRDPSNRFVKMRTELFDCRVFDVSEAAAAGCRERGIELGFWVSMSEKVISRGYPHPKRLHFYRLH